MQAPFDFFLIYIERFINVSLYKLLSHSETTLAKDIMRLGLFLHV